MENKENYNEVGICIQFNGIQIVSNFSKLSESELLSLEQIIEKCVGGDSKYLTFRKDNKRYYFPKEILSKSIISIVIKK